MFNAIGLPVHDVFASRCSVERWRIGCLQLFQLTLSEGKQKAYKARPQGNVGFLLTICYFKISKTVNTERRSPVVRRMDERRIRI